MTQLSASEQRNARPLAFGIRKSKSRFASKDRALGGLAGLLIGQAWRALRTTDGSEPPDTEAPPAFAAALRDVSRLLLSDRNGDLSDLPVRASTLLGAIQAQGDAESITDVIKGTLQQPVPLRASALRMALSARARLNGHWLTRDFIVRMLDGRREADSEQALIAESEGFEECGPLGDRDESFAQALSRLHDAGTGAVVDPVFAGLLGIEHGYYGLPAPWRNALATIPDFVAAQARILSGYAEEHDRPGIAVRTSITHPLRIGTLDLAPGHGRLGVTFCPGKQQQRAITGIWQRDLGLDLDAIRAWGATHILTLVETEELRELNVVSLPEAASARGIRWHHAAIVDGGIPGGDFESRWEALAASLCAALRHGESLVVHCKGGIGRAGTIAARLLLELGVSVDAEDAVARVRAARTNAVETAVQERFLLRCEDAMKGLRCREKRSA